MSKYSLCLTILAMTFMAAPAGADMLDGLADVTVVDGAIVSLRYADTEYVVADGDLALGTTTRWYVEGGVETLWVDGDPAPAATVPGSSDPKSGDVGSNADNFFFSTPEDADNISSIDGIDFQQTIFPFLTDTIFVFERNGNDNGTVQAILEDGSLGEPLTLTNRGAPYATTGVDVNGQTAYGYVLITDVPVQGLRISAPGHDALSISTPTPPPPDMEIGLATQPPLIDGEVDEIWAGASMQYFVPLDDPADASGSWMALYDSENLYVIVDVTDDSLQNDSASSWQDDSVEFYFDGGNTKLNTPLSGDDHQYTFGWTTDEVQGTNIAGATDGFEQAQVTTATGWRIEIKMPWLSLQGAAPKAGDLIGIDCYYNDDDDGGDSREGKMLTFSTVEFWNDASGWGTAVLAAAEPVDPGVEGLVAYYAFENDVNDSSGNGNNGTVVGDPNFVEGLAGHGMSLEFDGASYIDCGSDASLDIAGPISMSLWIKPGADDPEGQGTATAPMAKALSGASPSWSWQVRYGWNSPQPYMAFTFNTSPRAWAYVGRNLERDEWVHIACSHDGATLKCFLNGTETDSTPMGAITSSPTPLLIGSDGWRSDWIGGIDEVAIYNRGLSDGEIRYLAGYLPKPVDPGTENLAAFYTLDNDANDTSGNNNGTPSGDPQWVVGKIGGALEFDGVDDQVDCGNDPSLDITGPITIGAWFYPTGNGSSDFPRIIDKSDGTGGADPGYKLYLRGAQGYIFAFSAGGVYQPYSTMAAELNAWNYVAVIADGTHRKLYLNGAWEEWEESTLPSSSSNPLFIGNSPAGARHFQGMIDEVAIYNRALSGPEVRFIAGER